MNILIEKNTDHINIKVSGRLDGETSHDFVSETKDSVLPGMSIILDLRELEYLSSAGLRCILALARNAKSAGGTLAICGISDTVKEVLALSGFDKIIPITP